MSIQAYLTILISLTVNIVLLGIGVIAVLGIGGMNTEAAMLLPLVVLLSFAISPFISWRLMPRLTESHHHDDAHT